MNLIIEPEIKLVRSGSSGEDIAINTRRMVQPGFRSCDRQKARGAILPQRSRWVSASEQTLISGLRGDVEPHSNDVRKRKMTLKLHSRTPSLLQDSTSLPATAEFGFNTSSA